MSELKLILMSSLYAGSSHALLSALLPSLQVKNVFPRPDSVGDSDLKSQCTNRQ